jgi:hypothetical protein
VCHSSTGSLGCGDIGSHHRSGAVTKDCTLRSDQPLFRHSRGRRDALSLRKAHRYVPVLLQQIKLLKGPAWRQGGWAIMAQIDGRPKATTKSRWWTLGAAGIRKAPRASTFPKMMARRLAGGAAHRDAAKRRRRLACTEGSTVGPSDGPRDGPSSRCLWCSLAVPQGGLQEGWEGKVVVGPRGQLEALCACTGCSTRLVLDRA